MKTLIRLLQGKDQINSLLAYPYSPENLQKLRWVFCSTVTILRQLSPKYTSTVCVKAPSVAIFQWIVYIFKETPQYLCRLSCPSLWILFMLHNVFMKHCNVNTRIVDIYYNSCFSQMLPVISNPFSLTKNDENKRIKTFSNQRNFSMYTFLEM